MTPGNALSVLGFILVAGGSIRLYEGAWVMSLALIIGGRLLDVADGYVADLTQTKSITGELFDTLCDKGSVLVLITFAYSVHAFSLILLAIVFLHHLYTGIFGVVWGRRYQLHTNRYGKLAMLASWVAIITNVVSAQFKHNPVMYGLAALTIVVYVYFITMAIVTYHREVRKVTNR